MIKRRSRGQCPASTCCHTFRAIGITTYLDNEDTIEKAQAIMAHHLLYEHMEENINLDVYIIVQYEIT
jgi:hypothetical protein